MDLYTDASPEEDLLGRKAFSFQIANGLVTTSKNNDGFVTALTGKWGSGKSALLKFIREDLELLCKKATAPYKFIEFNPWIFSDAQNIKNTFLKHFAAEIGSRKISRLKKIGLWLSGKAPAIARLLKVNDKIGSDIGGLLKEYLDSDNSVKIKNKINNALQDKNEKIFVFIDDIDRLYPRQIFEVLQTLKLACNFKNTFYIIAYDREAVELSIESQFANYGKKYLDKIVQADFLIPEAPREKLESIFFTGLVEVMKNASINYITANLSSVWLHHGLRIYFATLRDIYRYLNSLQFSLPVIPEDIDITDFLILEAMRLYDFEGYQTLQADMNKSYSIVDSQVAFTSEKYLESYNQHSTRKLIQYLFAPSFKREFRKNRLNDSKFFERYFSLSINSSDIAELEFRRLLESNSQKSNLLEEIFKLGRIDNLIVRLNDREIFSQYKNWDYSLIDELVKFFDRNARNITKPDNFSNAVINLLTANEAESKIYFDNFLSFLTFPAHEVSYVRLYFMHYFTLSTQKNIGFANEFLSFGAFFSGKFTKIKGAYVEMLQRLEQHFVTVVIRFPLDFYTGIFIYDFAQYVKIPYEQKFPTLLKDPGSVLFFLKNIFGDGHEGNDFRVNEDTMKVFFPQDFKLQFAKVLKYVDISEFSEAQKRVRDYALEYFEPLNLSQ